MRTFEFCEPTLIIRRGREWPCHVNVHMTYVGTKGILEKRVNIKFGHATSMEKRFYVDVNLKLYQYITSRFLIEASRNTHFSVCWERDCLEKTLEQIRNFEFAREFSRDFLSSKPDCGAACADVPATQKTHELFSYRNHSSNEWIMVTAINHFTNGRLLYQVPGTDRPFRYRS